MAVVPKQNGLEILRKLIPLNTLPAESLERLLDVAVFEKHERDDVLFHEGDENRQRIYLLSGSLSIKAGKNEVDAITSGSNMARYPIAHQTPRKFSVIAKSKIETVSIENEFLSELFAKAEGAAYEVSSFEELVVDDDWMSQLLQLRAFQQIPAANIQNVMMRMEELKTLAGDVVISQGDEGDYFYLIHKGECLVSVAEEGGESKEVARIGPGDSFGEDALLSDNPRGSTVTMLTNGVLIRLGKQDFVDYVKRPLAAAVGFKDAQQQVADGAVWLDVRPTVEHLAGRLPGSLSIPFTTLRRRFSEIDSEQSYIVYCRNGQVSTTAAYLLLDHGISAAILKGGLEAVDSDQLESAGSNEGAKVIQLHGEQDAAVHGQIDSAEEDAKEIALLKARLARMEGIAKDQNLAARKIKAVLDQTRDKLVEVEGRNNTSEGQQAESQSLIEQLQRELGEVREQAAAGEKTRLAYQRQLAAITERAESLGRDLALRDKDDSEQQRALKEAKSELESQLAAVTEARDALQAELDAAETHSETLAQELAERQQQAEAGQQEKRAAEEQLTAELAEITSAHDALQAELDAAKTHSETLAQELAERQQQAEAGQQEKREAEEQLTAELTEVTSARDALQAELDAAKTHSETLAQELVERQQQAEAAAEGQLESERQALLEERQGLRDQLEALRSEYEEQLAAARVESEKQLQALTAQTSKNDELVAVKKELETLGHALDEADRSEQVARERIEALEVEGGSQREEIERLSRALDEASGSQSEVSSLHSTLDQAIEERAVAEQEVERLNSEVKELRGVMQQYAEQIKAAQQPAGGEGVAALRAELELVREQAENEVTQLQQKLESAQAAAKPRSAPSGGGLADETVLLLQLELEEARQKIKEHELTDSVDATESEAIRQEMDSLQNSLDERRRELENSRKETQLLEEKIEERNSEVDRLKLALEAAQGDAEEAEFSRNEAHEAKQLVEDALYKVQEKIEKERPADGLTDERLSSKKKVLDIEAGGAGKGLLAGGAIGALVLFGLLEVLSISAGTGEIIGAIFSGPAKTQSEALPLAPPPVQMATVPVPPRPPSPLAPDRPVQGAAEVQPAAPRESVQAERPVISSPVVVPEPVVAPAPVQAATPLPRDGLRGGGRAPEMIAIGGGDFVMGSDRSQLASEERPSHRVTVQRFAIGRHEVTFDDYGRFAQATGRSLPDDLGWGRGDRPVMNVSWEDASAYADWLSRQTGQRYRLPTEAEWEYAAAAGSDTTFWWGFQLGENRANCFNCGSRWDSKSTAPVGSFEPNDYGLHNTAGNVMEWVADCYHNSYQGAPEDGTAWLEPGCRKRVVRGGAFNKPGDSLRTTKRSGQEADSRLFVVGFRLAREL